MKSSRAPSLKARALQWLAQREHSRAELRRKLLPYARAAVQAAAGEEGGADDGACLRALEELLDWLEQNRYLCEQRFAESRVHARAARFGNLRIRQELAQHGVALDADTAQRLKDTELARAREVWARRFSAPPQDAAERARQMRFLAGRGFGADVIRRVLRADDDES